MRQTERAAEATEKVAFSIERDYRGVMSVPTYYRMPPEKRPRSVKIGSKRIIIESPAQYLERMAREQEQAAASAELQAA